MRLISVAAIGGGSSCRVTSAVSDNAPPVIQAYYRVLTGGIENYEDGRELLPLLADDLDF
ncbi:hypothetical protein [Pseudonocardia nigra]|uniref:hypothetical protein n=1 Tax=Pseudonocardia nigra TaxID=1921578 RepID=UPI001C5EAED1|nr:hypothetical protein [Pseudonocardia nigra]